MGSTLNNLVLMRKLLNERTITIAIVYRILQLIRYAIESIGDLYPLFYAFQETVLTILSKAVGFFVCIYLRLYFSLAGFSYDYTF